MIQLATDPNASRTNWRPAAADGKEDTVTSRRPRHAWPFIARFEERKPSAQETKRTPDSDGGS